MKGHGHMSGDGGSGAHTMGDEGSGAHAVGTEGHGTCSGDGGSGHMQWGWRVVGTCSGDGGSWAHSMLTCLHWNSPGLTVYLRLPFSERREEANQVLEGLRQRRDGGELTHR